MARSVLFQMLALGGCISLLACGYSLQTSRSELVEREGIHKLYIRPVTNNTLRLGVENIVYNALIRSVAAYRHVRLVQNLADADSFLDSTIWEVKSTVSASQSAGTFPVTFYSTLPVANEYSAQLVCQFSLFKIADSKGPTRLLWGSNFTRQKLFPAFVALGVPGTTSPLITETEFYRTIGDLAQSMMDDVHESMFSIF